MRQPATSRARKRLGQHFLHDQRVADAIVASARLAPAERVLEIGPGHGVLTQRLISADCDVVAIEVDPELARALPRVAQHSPRLQVVCHDAVTFDYDSLGRFDAVVANLPYVVSSPIMFRLFRVRWKRAVLMFQREFAQRLVAAAGTPDYGRLSAACAYYASASYLRTVKPGAFTPAPQVDSGIVRLERFASPPFEVSSEQAYLDFLRVVFSTRRKTLRRSILDGRAALGLESLTDEAAQAALDAWGDASLRPERVVPADLARLERTLREASDDAQ